MLADRTAALAWEEKWARPTAAVAAVAVVLSIAAAAVFQTIDAGENAAELLRAIDQNRGAIALSKGLEALGLGLLGVPLYYLFRAANARSETMRGQLVGVVIAAPIFLFVAAVIFIFSALDAATQFVGEEAPRLATEGVGIGSDEADDVASDLLSGSTLGQISAGFQLGGVIGFVVSMFYTALHAMRSGLLTRFWGSLGMALGAVFFFGPFRPFSVLWFAYLALLLVGWLPKGKPPAWETGRAMPWPTPGEKAAGELEGERNEDAGEEPPGEPHAPEGEEGEGEGEGAGRRKRKRRG